jgi:uncharacterized protein YkwD
MDLKHPLFMRGNPAWESLKLGLTFTTVALLSIIFMLFFAPSIQGKSAKAELNAAELINLTNQVRVENHLQSLSPNPLLTKAAHTKANDLFKNQYFSHNSPEGKKFSDWVKETDYNYIIVGENLATGFSSGEAVMAAWLGSDKHRENILQPRYREIGLAVVKGKFEGTETYMIVQYFGATDNLVLSENLLPYQSGWLNGTAELINS